MSPIDKALRTLRGSRTIAKPVAGSKGRGRGEASPSGLIRKLRKPIPPPTRVAEDERKYSRAREHERTRREAKDSLSC